MKTLEIEPPSFMSLIHFPASPRSAQYGDTFYSPMMLHGETFFDKVNRGRPSRIFAEFQYVN